MYISIEDVLEDIKIKIESLNPVNKQYLRSNGNDNGFEELFPIMALEVANKIFSPNTLLIHKHLGHHFPDFDLILNEKKYGVELKSRNNGTWITNGNSVLESITSEDYEEIFLLFATKKKNEDRLLIKYAPYWQATSSIKVTHSPRFTIDMSNLSDSVFESKSEYDSLRTMKDTEKIQFLQDYLKKNSNGAKWYTSDKESISITRFVDLSSEAKNQIISELLILFPDDLIIGSRNSKYRRSAEYILNEHYTYNTALRDLFSSGGQVSHNDVFFPQIINVFMEFSNIIEDTIDHASVDFFELAKMQWSQNIPRNLVTNNFLESYKNILNYIGENLAMKKYLDKTEDIKLSNLIFKS